MENNYSSIGGCLGGLFQMIIVIAGLFVLIAGSFKVVFPIFGMDSSNETCLAASAVVMLFVLAQAVVLKIIAEN
jgi:hypothetical protein